MDGCEIKSRKRISTKSSHKVERKPPTLKPSKPYPDFPLYAHASGQWAKKIRYKVYYFGVWADPDSALAEYVRQRDFLYAGITPPGGDDVTLDELVNRFLVEQRTRCDLGEISYRQFDDYRRDGKRVLESLGRARPVESLQPGDFTRLRATVLDGRNATTATNIIVRMRSIFAWGYRNRVLGRQVEYGDSFRLPSARARRQALRNRSKKTFTAAEIRTMLDATANHPKLHAMILLGINAALGNTDCAELRFSHINLKNGWLNFPRPKTGMERQAALWPETIVAIQHALEHRTNMRITSHELDGRVFVTRKGEVYVRRAANGTIINSIGMQIRRILDNKKLHFPGLGFYSLRHTFRTVADETKDFPAVDLIMGHVASDAGGAPHAIEMAARYREKISDERLQVIAEYVRKWLIEK
ncbi:MAG: hypothetical protein JW849_07450 [Phycisphaerae bacterium]|nr:hypothetical protein [Phycisphaerae bacterium]